MLTRSSGIRWPLHATLAIGLLASIETMAWGAGKGRPGGHGGKAPHVSAPRQGNMAPRMPHIRAPAHPNAMASRPAANATPGHSRNARSQTNRSLPHANHPSNRPAGPMGQASRTQARSQGGGASPAPTTAAGRHVAAGVGPAALASVNAMGRLSGSSSPYRYTYGSGSGARRYRAYGYGSGYRNRYFGAGYGYGRSQGMNRGIIMRLRSVHASLARLDHDYQGHRVRAMHAISMAVRQLSHRSMVYSGVGFAPGMNNRLGMGGGMGVGQGQGQRRSALGGAGAGRNGVRMPQAQSDAMMSQALRNLQGIGMQLGNQGSYNMGHGRAMGHIQQAIHELNVALSIR